MGTFTCISSLSLRWQESLGKDDSDVYARLGFGGYSENMHCASLHNEYDVTVSESHKSWIMAFMGMVRIEGRIRWLYQYSLEEITGSVVLIRYVILQSRLSKFASGE